MIRKLVDNSAFSILNNLVQLLVSLGSGIIIARSLGTEGKGEVFLITQIFNLIGVIFSFGFGPAIIFFLKNDRIPKARLNSFVLCYSILLALIFALSLLFFGSEISHLFSENFQFRLLILTFIIAHLNIASSLVGYKQMANENGVKRWSVITLISNLCYVLVLLLFLLLFKMQVTGVIYALVFGGLVKLLLLFYQPKVEGGYKLFLADDVKKLATFGFQIFLSNLFLTTVFRVDTFFLNKMVSLSQLGLYSVSVNVGELLLLIPSAIGVALFPHLSGLAREEQQQAMCLVGRISSLIGLIGIVGLGIIGYPFILIVFGRNFLSAFVPLLFLLPGLMAMTVNYSYSNYFSSIGKPMVGGIVFFIGLGFNVVLNLWLIPIFGISGAAISSSITYIVITTGFVLKIKQQDRLSIREFLFPKKSDFIYIKEKVMAFISKK